MATMTAVDAAVQVLRKEGITQAFGVPGAAINPLYAAQNNLGGIDHILVRHINITEFEALAERREDAPTAIALLD